MANQALLIFKSEPETQTVVAFAAAGEWWSFSIFSCNGFCEPFQIEGTQFLDEDHTPPLDPESTSSKPSLSDNRSKPSAITDCFKEEKHRFFHARSKQRAGSITDSVPPSEESCSCNQPFQHPIRGSIAELFGLKSGYELPKFQKGQDSQDQDLEVDDDPHASGEESEQEESDRQFINQPNPGSSTSTASMCSLFDESVLSI